ncbi:hypothetical protein SLS53_005677 [Cytospora paraplurivora]|uniref:Uncharacterized protein n=1 Tax=Cytospora paraplurivora TaxID=2898453 RepID=A0AAN9YG11_9PEZI
MVTNMTNQGEQVNTSTISRMKIRVRSIATKLHILPAKKQAQTATPEAAIIPGASTKLNVLPPTTPPSPPRGSLIAEKNWHEVSGGRRHSQRTCSTAAKSRMLPARRAGTEASSVSDRDSNTTGRESWSTNATSHDFSPEEAVVSAKKSNAEDAGSRAVVPQHAGS